MKAEILALLREQGSYVSGQELCERFGVSRTAVWKAINQLKKEGYQISAVQNKGYLLEQEEEIFGQNELESRMDTAWAGHPVSFYAQINSTNLQAKLDAEAGAGEGALVVADMQTAGRGRRGRTWNSPAGTNVYFTLLLKPAYPVDKVSAVTLVMALAVAEGIRETCGLDTGIKWPNDVVVNGHKVCGILTEMNTEVDYINYVVIGIGINVNQKEFPEEIREIAGSLCLEAGKQIGRAALIAAIMEELERIYEIFQKTEDLSELYEEYNQICVNCGRKIRVLEPGHEYTGVAEGINQDGELMVVRDDTGEKVSVYAGEVSVRGFYGYV